MDDWRRACAGHVVNRAGQHPSASRVDDLTLNLLEAARMKVTPHLPFISIECEQEWLKIFRPSALAVYRRSHVLAPRGATTRQAFAQKTPDRAPFSAPN